MATTMDIRLDYGAWPGEDDAETTESASSRDRSPPYHSTHQVGEHQLGNPLTRQHSSALSLSDLFSDSGYSINTEDFFDAETNMASTFHPSQNTTHHQTQTSHSRAGTNLPDPSQSSSHDSPIIDLTASPPRNTVRTITRPVEVSLPPTSQEHANMPSTLRSRLHSRRAPSEAPHPPSHAEAHPRKRRRLSGRSTAVGRVQITTNNLPEVEAVDLTEVNDESDLSEAISKQQQDAVQAQMKDNLFDDSTGRTSLSSYKCPICMDTPEDATSTVCGEWPHGFCCQDISC